MKLNNIYTIMLYQKKPQILIGIHFLLLARNVYHCLSDPSCSSPVLSLFIFYPLHTGHSEYFFCHFFVGS